MRGGDGARLGAGAEGLLGLCRVFSSLRKQAPTMTSSFGRDQAPAQVTLKSEIRIINNFYFAFHREWFLYTYVECSVKSVNTTKNKRTLKSPQLIIFIKNKLAFSTIITKLCRSTHFVCNCSNLINRMKRHGNIGSHGRK